MSFKITDGKGSGKEAAVDTSNRMRVRGVIETEQAHATELEQSYNINTGTVTLTAATASAVFYFKNNEDNNFYLTSLVYDVGASTNGVGSATIDAYFQTTTGTIVSGATDVDINVNLSVGSANTITADAYKGAEGLTRTNGTQAVSSLVPTGGRPITVSLGKVIIPKGQTLCVEVTPPTSNTSMPVQVAVYGFIANPTVIGGGTVT